MICERCRSVLVEQLDERPHHEVLQESTRQLYESVQAGCFICSTYWKCVERAARRMAKDPLEVNGQLACAWSPVRESAHWSGYELQFEFEGSAVLPLSFWLVQYKGNCRAIRSRLRVDAESSSNLQVSSYRGGVE